MNKWGIMLAAGAAFAAAETGIAGYFFKRTMIRQNAKQERTVKMAGTNWEGYFPEMRRRREWLSTKEREDVWIQSKDGLRLHGTFFPAEGSKKTILCLHGYTSKGMNDYASIASFYLPLGYNMLMIDERAHGESEGHYIGFGCLDRWDTKEWIDYLDRRLKGEGEIFLHGTSMGAATALMTSGLKLPDCVKGIISDCAFTSPWEMFSSVLKNMYHIPPFPILNISDHMTVKKAGYSLKECNAKEEVKKAKVPILFIHGSADSFVPPYMCRELYESCTAPKDILIIEGAGHAESYYKETKKYEEKVKALLEGRVK